MVARKSCFGLPTSCPYCLPFYLYLKFARVPFDLCFNGIYPDSGNVLLLRNQLNLSADASEVLQEKLLSLVAEQLIDSNSNVNNQQQNISDAIDLLPRLTTWIDLCCSLRKIMAPKYQILTDVYVVLWDLLKEARIAEFRCGGLRMSDETWFYFMKEIVSRDLILAALRTEAASLRERWNAMETVSAKTHAQLSKMEIELVEIEISFEANRRKEIETVQSAEELKHNLRSNYID